MVRSVNSNMVVAYWLIGREIVQELQGCDKRADYGRQVIEDLSNRLTKRYRKGFSTTNLWYFRQFYQAYPNRLSILHPGGGESAKDEKLWMKKMIQKHQAVDLFAHGSTWLRADFHLHTRADADAE